MEQNYISGLFCKKNEKAPEFVLCNLDIKADEFIKWLQDNKNERGYINLQVLNSKQGKPYIKKNDFKKR